MHPTHFWLRPRSGREAGGLIGATGCMRARGKRWPLPLRSGARVTRRLVLPRGPTSLTDNLASGDQSESVVKLGAIEARQVTIDGQLLQVAVRHGGGSGPPLLLFNGIGANWELAKPFLEALTSTTAIIFDVPGVGGFPRGPLPHCPSAVARAAAPSVAQLGSTEKDVAPGGLGGGIVEHFAS